MSALSRTEFLLNCAGPFKDTAPPLVGACLRSSTHYLDTTGELTVLQWIVALDEEAKRRGVMLLPGVGFDLVPSDYLARYLKTRLPSAVTLRLYRSGFESLSQGSAKTLVDALGEAVFVRRRDRLIRVPVGWRRRKVNWGDGPRDAIIIPWVDVLTAYRTTHVPTIAGIVGFLVLFLVTNRWGSLKRVVTNPSALLPLSLGAFFGPFLGVSLGMFALKHTETGVAATLMALVPITIIPPSVVMFKERVTPFELIGTLLAVTGVTLLFTS